MTMKIQQMIIATLFEIAKKENVNQLKCQSISDIQKAI